MPDCSEPGPYPSTFSVNPAPSRILVCFLLPLFLESLHLVSSRAHVCRGGTKPQGVGRFPFSSLLLMFSVCG